jgi:hypothetical protein
MRGLFIIMILSALGLISAAYVWPAFACALIAAAGLLVAYGVLAPKAQHAPDLSLASAERARAYGFDVAPGDSPGTFAMAITADRQRRLTIRILNDCRW